MISVNERVGHTVGKGGNDGFPAFSLFPTMFSKGFFLRIVKSRDCVVELTLSQTANSDSSEMKVFADDNFKFDENGRRFSKQVENTVGKGEIARYEQFLLFPQCFQKACSADT